MKTSVGFSVSQTATYATRMRGYVGGALSFRLYRIYPLSYKWHICEFDL